MNPLDDLQTMFAPFLNTNPALEAQFKAFCNRFALVPREEYEAHLRQLTDLSEQVAALEARVDELST